MMGWCVMLVCLLGGLSRAQAACTSAELASELTTDPRSLGYAAHVASGNDAALLALLTTGREGEGYIVSKGLVSTQSARGTWGDVITLVQTNPPGGNSTLRDKWKWNIEALFVPFGTIDYSDPATTGFFAAMVTDQLLTSTGVITNEIVTARTTRQGSRAEVLCGVKSTDRVTLAAISCALRSHGCP